MSVTFDLEDDLRIQVLGLCRFSVPSLGAFQKRHDSIAARRAMLYASDRLAQRFVWFEHVTLPAIRAQTDPDFTFVVLLGEDFPEPWHGRMRALVADIPQVRLAYAAPADHREECARAVRAAVDPSADMVAEFRLDDDDAVAIDFVARVREEAPALSALFLRHGNAALDFTRGLVLADGPDGPVPVPRRALYWTPALAVLTRPDAEERILDFPHHRLWTAMPTLTLHDDVMFLRGAHDMNDSRIVPEEPAWQLPEARQATLLMRRFRVDLAGFAAALAAAKAR
jgi:hypothetical protein